MKFKGHASKCLVCTVPAGDGLSLFGRYSDDQIQVTCIDSDSDSDSDRGLFNIKLHTTVLHQVYIAEQYEHIEQIWTWHNQKYLLGDLY